MTERNVPIGTNPDPDVVLITKYLTGDLPSAEARAVDERLETDAKFREKVSPLIWLWKQPIDLGPETDRLIDEVLDEVVDEMAGDDAALDLNVDAYLASIPEGDRPRVQAAWNRVTEHAGLRGSDIVTGRPVGRRSRRQRFTEWAYWL